MHIGVATNKVFELVDEVFPLLVSVCDFLKLADKSFLCNVAVFRLLGQLQNVLKVVILRTVLVQKLLHFGSKPIKVNTAASVIEVNYCRGTS